MFDRFGCFDSAAGINATAENLKREGDLESLKVLAAENGIDEDDVEAFAAGEQPDLCDAITAAIGRLEMESKEINCAEIMEDWVEYIKAQCTGDPDVAAAVRKKDKSLAGCIAKLLQWSFSHQHAVDSGILAEAGIKASRCTLGIPGMRTAKRIIIDYYLDGKK